jgi:hypothetical protein
MSTMSLGSSWVVGRGPLFVVLTMVLLTMVLLMQRLCFLLPSAQVQRHRATGNMSGEHKRMESGATWRRQDPVAAAQKHGEGQQDVEVIWNPCRSCALLGALKNQDADVRIVAFALRISGPHVKTSRI